MTDNELELRAVLESSLIQHDTVAEYAHGEECPAQACEDEDCDCPRELEELHDEEATGPHVHERTNCTCAVWPSQDIAARIRTVLQRTMPKASPMPGADPLPVWTGTLEDAMRTFVEANASGDPRATILAMERLLTFISPLVREIESLRKAAADSSGSARERALAWLKEYEVDPDLDRVESLTALLSSPFTSHAPEKKT